MGDRHKRRFMVQIPTTQVFFQLIIYKNYKTFTFYDFQTEESESLNMHFQRICYGHPSIQYHYKSYLTSLMEKKGYKSDELYRRQ